MAKGNIQLDGVHYITDGLPRKSLANQMASKVGQGQSQYGDLTSWSAWIQEDWQEGVGKLKPHLRGGFLYGEVETRVPSQIILPVLPDHTDRASLLNNEGSARHMPNYGGLPTSVNGTRNLILGSSSARAAMRIQLLEDWTVSKEVTVWFYLRAPVGTQITLEVRNNSSNLPGSTLYSSGSFTTINDDKSFHWLGVKMAGHASMTALTQVWLIIYPTSAGDTVSLVHGGSVSSYPTAAAVYNGSAWASAAGEYLYFSTNVHWVFASNHLSASMFRIGTTIYASMGDAFFKLVAGSPPRWSQQSMTGFGDTYIVNAVEFLGVAYVATDDNLHTLTSGGAWTDTGTDAHVVARHDGFIWRAVDNEPYYSSDASTWVHHDTMDVGTPEYPIINMCGVDENMFISTAEALYRCAPGDFSVLVTPWSSVDSRNGTSMVNFQGSLYVAANGRVMRYMSDGALQDVWVGRDDDLVAGRLGRVRCLCVVNNEVWALANAESEGSIPTMWALHNEEWHHITSLPYTPVFSNVTEHGRNYAMIHDGDTNYLWVSMPSGVIYRLYVSEIAINPYNDGDSQYLPYGWIEWDWFDGLVLEAQKDFHSVVLFGDLEAGMTATVYWKDDDSTDWELLETSFDNGQELKEIWGIDYSRPNTKRLKMALLLATGISLTTPRIRAFRVKYHLMVTDWWRWSLNIDVKGTSSAYQMTRDGTRHNLTAEQMITNLDALSAGKVPPFVYVDIDGKQWLVKVQDAQFTPTLQVYNEDTGFSHVEGTYSMTIESVQAEEYEPPP